MKEISKKHLEEITNKIQDNDFSSIELTALFIICRQDNTCPKIIKELGHFVAHIEKRDHGKCSEDISKFYQEFARICREGGTIFPKQLFSQNEVISGLIEILKRNKIACLDVKKFSNQTFKIMYGVLEIVSETKIIDKETKQEISQFSAITETPDGYGLSICFDQPPPLKGTLKLCFPALAAIETKGSGPDCSARKQ